MQRDISLFFFYFQRSLLLRTFATVLGGRAPPLPPPPPFNQYPDDRAARSLLTDAMIKDSFVSPFYAITGAAGENDRESNSSGDSLKFRWSKSPLEID